MELYRTVDSDGYIRIEENGGAAVTLYIHEGIADILSLFVPKSDRGEGIGSMLLAAAEQVAYTRGAARIEADYAQEIKGMTELFEGAGYVVRESAPICAADTGEVLASDRVKNTLKKKFPNARFASLEELMMMQWDEFLGILSRFSVRLTVSDMSRFSQSMSGIVYDQEDVAQAFILCTEKEHAVHIDFLGAAGKSNSVYVMAALQGMMMEVFSAGGEKKYPVITALCAQDHIFKLMDSVLPGKPEQIGMAMYAAKELDENSGADSELEDDLDEDMIGEWNREIAKVPMQVNIGWKVAWYRERQREKDRALARKRAKEVSQNGDGATASGEETSVGTAAPETATTGGTSVKTAAPGIGTTGKTSGGTTAPWTGTSGGTEATGGRGAGRTGAESAESDRPFPYELPDPRDIDYGFEKDEDETDGLIYHDTRRITVENLDEFEGRLPEDALQDIPRPWHRGLTTGDGGKPSYLVYELTDVDDEENTGARIRWSRLSEDADKLLDEFIHEAKSAGVTRSSIETRQDDTIEFVLAGAGFFTEKRESTDIAVTVGELGKLPFTAKKTPENVVGLDGISLRQFKRGIGNCMIHNRKGLLEDIAFLPIEWFEQDVSSVVLTEERVSGMLLVHQLPSGRLMVDLLFSSSGDAQMDILRMITRAIREAVDKYPAGTPVIIRRHNKRVFALTDRLFPGKKGAAVLYAERREG